MRTSKPIVSLLLLDKLSSRELLNRWRLSKSCPLFSASVLILSLSIFSSESAIAMPCTLTDSTQDDTNTLNESRTLMQLQAIVVKVRANYNPDLDIDRGFLDVTRPPYNADKTGGVDATCALQRALLDARDAQLVTFLPVGIYKISNQLRCIQGYIVPEGDAFDNLNRGASTQRSEDFPCVIRGSTKNGGRAKLVLAAGSFTDINHPEGRAMIFFSSRDWNSMGAFLNPNIAFNQMIISLDLEIQINNATAIGIENQAAQGSTIEDVNIAGEDLDGTPGGFTYSSFMAGVRGLPGVGGITSHVSVIGGEYGIYAVKNDVDFVDEDHVTREGVLIPTPASQPSTLISVVTLKFQRTNSIVYKGRGPLTVVGAVIEGSVPILVDNLNEKSMWDGHLNMVDSVIRFTGTTPVIRSNRNVYLNYVHIRYSQPNPVLFQSYSKLPGQPPAQTLLGSSTWTLVTEYAAGGNNSGNCESGIAPDNLCFPLWINWTAGARGTELENKQVVTAPQESDSVIQGWHSWNRGTSQFPTWEDPNVVVISADATGMANTATIINNAINANPGKTLFLPKGRYKLSQPIQLTTAAAHNTRLIGVGSMFTILFADRDSDTYKSNEPTLTNASPLITTASNATDNPTLGFLQLRAVRHRAYALFWRAGAESIVRDVNYKRTPWVDRDVDDDNIPAAVSLIRIDGPNGGGRWYNTWQASVEFPNSPQGPTQGATYRILRVASTTQPLNSTAWRPRTRPAITTWSFSTPARSISSAWKEKPRRRLRPPSDPYCEYTTRPISGFSVMAGLVMRTLLPAPPPEKGCSASTATALPLPPAVMTSSWPISISN